MSEDSSQYPADTPAQQKLRDILIAEKQEHLYKDWKASDTKEQRKQFYDQIATLDGAYPGGLKAYLASARDLLAASAKGISGSRYDECSSESTIWRKSTPSWRNMKMRSSRWAGLVMSADRR